MLDAAFTGCAAGDYWLLLGVRHVLALSRCFPFSLFFVDTFGAICRFCIRKTFLVLFKRNVRQTCDFADQLAVVLLHLFGVTVRQHHKEIIAPVSFVSLHFAPPVSAVRTPHLPRWTGSTQGEAVPIHRSAPREPSW